MRTVSPVNLGELLNLVGLSTGVALYAMLLAMVIRARRRAGDTASSDPLLLLTSILGLLWNLCALPGYVLPKFGIAGPSLISAIGFGALGLLPAAVVHSVLRGGSKTIAGPARRIIALSAYAVSALAATLQIALPSAAGPFHPPTRCGCSPMRSCRWVCRSWRRRGGSPGRDARCGSRRSRCSRCPRCT